MDIIGIGKIKYFEGASGVISWQESTGSSANPKEVYFTAPNEAFRLGELVQFILKQDSHVLSPEATQVRHLSSRLK